MRPALEYASSIWSPLASSTSFKKLKVIQNAALRTATGCTKDTNIQHLHDEILVLPIHDDLQLHASQYKQKHNIHHTPYTNIQHISTLQGKKTLSLTTAATQQTFPQTPNNHYNRHKNKHAPYTWHASIVSRHLATRGNKKYCAHLHHALAALKRYFLTHIYTKPTPNHIHHHYAPFVTLTHMTHIISSTNGNISHICTTLSPLDL